MKSRFLLPHQYRLYGWIIFVPCAVIGILAVQNEFQFDFLTFKLRDAKDFFDSEFENFTNELAAVGVLVGLMFIAFSRERIEDEYIQKLRLDSLLVAVIINYVVLALALIFLYSFDFLNFMIYNMFTVLVLFIIRFYWVKRRQEKALEA